MGPVYGPHPLADWSHEELPHGRGRHRAAGPLVFRGGALAPARLDEPAALVGIELWPASKLLPTELLEALPRLEGRGRSFSGSRSGFSAHKRLAPCPRRA